MKQKLEKKKKKTWVNFIHNKGWNSKGSNRKSHEMKDKQLHLYTIGLYNKVAIKNRRCFGHGSNKFWCL